MTPAQLKRAAFTIATILTCAGYIGWRSHERTVGKLEVLLHQADSVHAADSVTAQEQSAQAQVAAQEADQQRRAALVEASHADALRASTEIAARLVSNERDTARRLLNDTAATVSQLRVELGQLVQASARDSTAARQQHIADQLAIAELRHALALDATAIARGLDATNAAIARAVAAESQAQLVRRSQSSTIGNVAKAGLLAGAAYLLGHLTR